MLMGNQTRRYSLDSVLKLNDPLNCHRCGISKSKTRALFDHAGVANQDVITTPAPKLLMR